MKDSAVVLLREIKCWSLLGFNGLIFLLVSFFIDESTLTCLCFKVLPPKLTVISELTPNQSSVLRQNFLSTSDNLLDFSPVYSGKSGLKKAQLKKGDHQGSCDDEEKIVSRTCNNHPAEHHSPWSRGGSVDCSKCGSGKSKLLEEALNPINTSSKSVSVGKDRETHKSYLVLSPYFSPSSVYTLIHTIRILFCEKITRTVKLISNRLLS